MFPSTELQRASSSPTSTSLAGFRPSATTLTAIVLAQSASAALPGGIGFDDLGQDQLTELPRFSVEDAKVKSPTSPKFTEPLRDVPQTVVVIPDSVYVQQAATSLRDVLRNTPGITFVAGEGGNAPGDNLFIRGFSARNDVFIDGVRDPGVVSRDTFNIDQVEVAKGPSSATSGRGSTGGSINLVTKTPHAGNFTHVEATYGTADYGRATLDANFSLPSSPVQGTAVRVNAVWTDGGVAGRDVVKNANLGVAPSITLGLGTPTEVTLAYEHVSQDNVPDYGLPGTLPAGALAAGQTLADLDWSNFYGLASRDYERIDTDLATITATHRLNDHASLRNLTRYGRNTRDAIVTPPRAASVPPTAPSTTNGMLDPGYNPTLPQIRRTDAKYQDRQDEIVANQTDFAGRFQTGSIRHSIDTGIEVSRENQKNYARADTYANGRPPVTDLYHPNPYDIYVPTVARTGAYGSAIADSGAFYAFDSLKLNQRWELNLGSRFEIFDVSYKSVDASGLATRFQRTDDMLSWRAGLVFKPVAIGSIYAGFGTSFNPSADASQGLQLGSSGNTSANLGPEKNLSSELGTKWELLHRRLIATAAVFRTGKTNARTTDADGNTVLAGNQRVQGVELGAAGSLTDAWTLFAGYAYMDSRILASGIPQQVDAALQYAPRHSLNLWTTYRFPIGLTIGGGAQYIAGYFYALPSATAATPNQGLGTQYTIYNAMLSYELTKHLTLRLNVNNLAGKRYIDRGYNGHVIPGPGRTLLLTADLKW
ncbi:MAG TPA: TonB-dependent siderophore receptor [Opitutus sp.]|nr:TonB-dependent siderophore receptor [Opitutus sp.]